MYDRVLKSCRGIPVVLFVTAAACSAGEEGQPEGSPSAGAGVLRGEVLNKSDSLAQPVALAKVGEHLVVVDAINEPAVHVVRASDGALVRSFGRKGSGPGEFRGARSVATSPRKESEFWVYDIELSRLTRFDLRDSTRSGDHSLTFSSGILPMELAWLGDSVLVGTGIFQEGRLALFDTAGRMLRTIGSVPGAEDGKVPVSVLQHAYTGTVAPAPDRTRVALVTRHADRLEIYPADGAGATIVRGPDGFDPAFEVRQLKGHPYMATGEDLRFGYIDVTTTDDLVFALYSGRTRREHPGRASFADRVHVYDWSGNLKQVLKLDSAVIDIAVDQEGGRLYAIRHDPAPSIVAYSLEGVEL